MEERRESFASSKMWINAECKDWRYRGQDWTPWCHDKVEHQRQALGTSTLLLDQEKNGRCILLEDGQSIDMASDATYSHHQHGHPHDNKRDCKACGTV